MVLAQIVRVPIEKLVDKVCAKPRENQRVGGFLLNACRPAPGLGPQAVEFYLAGCQDKSRIISFLILFSHNNLAAQVVPESIRTQPNCFRPDELETYFVVQQALNCLE